MADVAAGHVHAPRVADDAGDAECRGCGVCAGCVELAAPTYDALLHLPVQVCAVCWLPLFVGELAARVCNPCVVRITPAARGLS